MKDDNSKYGAELLDTMDGDIEAARMMAELFFETGREQLTAIKIAASERRCEELAFHAHKCAGGAGACGFNDLAGAMRELEINSIERDWDSLQSDVERVVGIFEETQKAVGDFFKWTQDR